MYKVDVTPVVGLPQFSGWSQVVSNYQSSGQLVCAFSVSGDHAGNVGRDLTEQISQAQIETSTELHQFIFDLIKEAQDLDVEVNLACGVFKTNKVILGAVGGSVFLKRHERTGVILGSANELKIIEGKRRAGDIVVLSTNQASDFVQEIEQKFISGFDTDSVVTSIIPGLHGLDDSSLSSIAFVTGGQEFKEDIEVINGEESEPLLDIPPALRLRGAGKKRSEDDEVEASPLLSPEPTLSRLGQVKTAHPVMALIGKAGHKIVSLIRISFSWLKSIKWHQFFANIVRILSRIKNWLVEIVKRSISLVRRLIARDIYLKPQSPRKLIRVILPIVIVVIILVLLIGWRIFGVRKQVGAAETMLSPLIEQISLAKDQTTTDPILARETVSQAITSLEQLEQDLSDQKKARGLVAQQLSSARELFDQISGQEEFGQLEIFYDLRLIDGEFVVSGVDMTNKQAILLDAGRKKAVVLNLENKQAQELDLSAIDQVNDLEITDQLLTVLGQGIYQQDFEEEQVTLNKIIEQGDSNKDAVFIESFATYIYVFNPEKRNVYRYSQQEDGYSDPIGWVSGAVSFDYNNVSSWAIDGDMWITTRAGGLYKLASGREQEFKIVGLIEPFSDNLQVFTHEDVKNIYILEPNGKRLVMLTKAGEFLKEIKSDSLASTTTLFVSEELGKAFAVSGSIIYAMSI